MGLGGGSGPLPEQKLVELQKDLESYSLLVRYWRRHEAPDQVEIYTRYASETQQEIDTLKQAFSLENKLEGAE